MNETERHIRQAIRGLSAQARRDAQQELRGAIEDKGWRFTLFGLQEDAATRAALRDRVIKRTGPLTTGTFLQPLGLTYQNPQASSLGSQLRATPAGVKKIGFQTLEQAHR